MFLQSAHGVTQTHHEWETWESVLAMCSETPAIQMIFVHVSIRDFRRPSNRPRTSTSGPKPAQLSETSYPECAQRDLVSGWLCPGRRAEFPQAIINNLISLCEGEEHKRDGEHSSCVLFGHGLKTSADFCWWFKPSGAPAGSSRRGRSAAISISNCSKLQFVSASVELLKPPLNICAVEVPGWIYVEELEKIRSPA